jgi:hypothetical protein
MTSTRRRWSGFGDDGVARFGRESCCFDWQGRVKDLRGDLASHWHPRPSLSATATWSRRRRVGLWEEEEDFIFSPYPKRYSAPGWWLGRWAISVGCGPGKSLLLFFFLFCFLLFYSIFCF